MFFIVLKVWGDVGAYAVRHVKGYIRALRKQGKTVDVLYATHTPHAARLAYAFNGKTAEERARMSPEDLCAFAQAD